MEKFENNYFAASNSMEGFKSYFDDIFDSHAVDYLYIIKGGSGTGKSRFMREIAKAACEKGEFVEYFYCSSDPKSLDGIILCERRIGIIDGTSPHTVEPTLPGCKEEIINLGEFLDSKLLREHLPYIEELLCEKKALYKWTYTFLAAAGKCDRITDKLVKATIEKDKLESWAERFVKKLTASKSFDITVRLRSSISYMGEYSYDTTGSYDTKYFVTEKFNAEYALMQVLYEAAAARKVKMTISFAPLDPNKIDAIYFVDDKIAVTVTKGKDIQCGNVINTSRFINADSFREIRSRVRFVEKTKTTFVDIAVDIMKDIFKAHTKIEEIYSSAMDFTKKEECTAKLIEKIWN